MINRLEERNEWIIPQNELSLYKREPRSPWLIAPQQVIKIIRKMQTVGPRLGDRIRIHMGIKTAANPVYIVKGIKSSDDPGVSLVEMQNGSIEKIEENLIQYFIRGRDIDAWKFRIGDHIVWTHDHAGKPLSQLPENAREYFSRNDINNILVNRADYSSGQKPWIIFRVSENKLKDKTAWQMIAKELESVYLPAEYDNGKGSKMLIIDHALYFIVTESQQLGYIMSAVLNSTLINAYIAPYVNRTGAAYCQYFAWILALLHIPENISEASELAEISRALHEGGLTDIYRIDGIIGKYYNLLEDEIHEMRKFFNFFKKSK